MFFLVAIIFIIQLFLLSVIVSFLLNIDINILILTDKIEDYNNWLKTRNQQIENIFSDIKFILKYKQKQLKKYRQKLLIKRIIAIIEWLLFITLKPKGKKFILGYKISRILLKELSIKKNMV